MHRCEMAGADSSATSKVYYFSFIANDNFEIIPKEFLPDAPDKFAPIETEIETDCNTNWGGIYDTVEIDDIVVKLVFNGAARDEKIFHRPRICKGTYYFKLEHLPTKTSTKTSILFDGSPQADIVYNIRVGHINLIRGEHHSLRPIGISHLFEKHEEEDEDEEYEDEHNPNFKMTTELHDVVTVQELCKKEDFPYETIDPFLVC